MFLRETYTFHLIIIYNFAELNQIPVHTFMVHIFTGLPDFFIKPSQPTKPPRLPKHEKRKLSKLEKV